MSVVRQNRGPLFIIPAEVKLSIMQNQNLGRFGVQHGLAFSVGNAGLMTPVLHRKKLKTVSNKGSILVSSVKLCSMWHTATRKVHFSLSFAYSAIEVMDLKVFFAAKDMHSAISLRKQVQGTKKWEGIMLPPGNDKHWDSAKEGLYLESSDPVFMRMLRGSSGSEEITGLYDMIIVLSPRQGDLEQPQAETRSPTCSSRHIHTSGSGGDYGAVAMVDVDDQAGSPSPPSSSPSPSSSSPSPPSRLVSLTHRWEEAKKGMLRGLRGSRSVRSIEDESDTEGRHHSYGDRHIEPVQVACEKSRFQLMVAAPLWTGPSELDLVSGDGEWVVGPLVPLECAAQVVQVAQIDYVMKDVYGGQWERLTPCARADMVRIEDLEEAGAPEGGETKMSSRRGVDFGTIDYQDTYCVICMSEPREVIVHPCNHCCCCSQCAGVFSSIQGQLDRNHNRRAQDAVKCPMCRVAITAMVHLVTSDKEERRTRSSSPAKG